MTIPLSAPEQTTAALPSDLYRLRFLVNAASDCVAELFKLYQRLTATAAR